MVNPIINSRKYLYSYISFWSAIVVLLSALLHLAIDFTWLDASTTAFIYVSTFAIIGLNIWFIVRFSDLESNKLFDAVMTHITAATLLIILWLSISNAINSQIFNTSWYLLDAPADTIWWWAAFGFFFYVITTLCYYLLIFYQNYKDKLLRESEMKRLVKESELSMLKAQINPHFIFNSLNSISTLTLTDPNNAHEMIIKLSTFLRHTIGQSEMDLIPVQVEIETIQLYLDIEKSRFGNKLKVDISGLKKLPLGTKIPNLILQPLVENAIKYGVYESIENTSINVAMRMESNLLYITIENQIEPDASPQKGKGIGLKNVKSRLQLLFERIDLLNTTLTDNIFKVELIIPQTKDAT